ncbi:MAG: FAD-dependent oxidoreductase [Oscillospiraceae bacterium]|nr:FAD-dependent oxidoreductase [Oscillospiraceae bacterium]
MDSVWRRTLSMPRFEPLQKNIDTDVLIIGGGMAGILCAWQLRQAGIDCVLAEQDRICSGITKNTTAKITLQHGLLYHKLGEEKAALYLHANQAALEQYRKLCQTIDCDFEIQDSFVYSVDDIKCIENEAAALKKLGVDARIQTELPLPFSVKSAVQVKNQAQFHPLKFVSSIAEGLPIYEHTKVQELMPGKAVTNGGVIRAKKTIVATHFPVLNKHGGYFLKLYQHRSYVLALKDVPRISGMYVDEAKTGVSFRPYRDLLLLGGGAHRTGKEGGNWRELERFAAEYFPRAQIVLRWATQDCMTLDGAPYIGQYAKSTPDLYVATGFNKWGMTTSMVAAMLLGDLIQGKTNPWSGVFDPSRSVLHPQLAVNAMETVLNLITPTVPRCPHMGCALKYNPDERSWDCPCHGSRFDREGCLLDNPATDDKKRLNDNSMTEC